MTTIRARLPDTIGALKIEVMADLHIGDAHCDLPLIRDRLKSVQEEPDTALILNGDILNNATKTSVSDCYSEVLPPMEQIQRAVQMEPGNTVYQNAMQSMRQSGSTYNETGQEFQKYAEGMGRFCTAFMIMQFCCLFCRC